MIPKTIHYCWFGHNPKPKLAKRCIRSWKRYCKGYQIIEWNEENYDLSSAPLYVRQAYEAKKWAFVTDYVRLDIVWRHGGIYLDTDVEVLRSLEVLLNNRSYFGFEGKTYIATGLGFGAEKGTNILLEMMLDYDEIPYIKEDGSFDTTPCPRRNTKVLLKHGLRQDGSEQILDGGIHIYPAEYFCPRIGYGGKRHITKNTFSDHYFDASWAEKESKRKWASSAKKLDRSIQRKKVSRCMKVLLGERCFEMLKRMKNATISLVKKGCEEGNSK